MKIFFLSLHGPLDSSRVATGNQVRDAALIRALRDAGHEVLQHCATESREADLARRIRDSGADAIHVGYWTLLEQLPDTDLPVVLDFIAPRLLEAMFQERGTVQYEGRRLLTLLPRADHFLVGNARQADLLLGLLLLAGFDCRERTPVSVVPIAVSGEPEPFARAFDVIRLVSAGVDWPWRQSADYLAAIEDYARAHPRIQLQHLCGSYPASGKPDGGQGLASHAELGELLTRCHIGLELGRRNTERAFSHSFRLADYLQAGLPVILNSWLPAAALVERYEAGWIVDEPAELPALLDALTTDPESIARKAAGARRLALEALNYREAARPLLAWLASPWQPGRDTLAATLPATAPVTAPVLARRGFGARLRHVVAEGLSLVLGRGRPAQAPDVLVVTRADLFPADHGAAVKILHTAEALSRLGGDVYLCTDDRRRYYRFHRGEREELRYPVWLRLLALPRPLALLRLLWRGMPWSNAFLYFPLTDESYVARVLWLCTRHPIGAYQAEFPAYVQPLRVARRLFGGPLVLVEHNVEYERVRAQVPDLSDAGYTFLKQVELRLCAAADAVVAVSEDDRRKLVADGVDPRRIEVIPHGVDLQTLRSAHPRAVREELGIDAGRPLLVYHGTYSYPPNLEAMNLMAREVLPRLRARGIEASVLAIGSRPPEHSPDPDIHFTGSVENLAEWLAAADLAVVPLREGGGTRMKILDYFAAGVPVVSTAKGIEGIPVRDGVEARIADDIDVLCAAAEELLRRPEAARRQVERASAFVEALDWQAVTRRYLPLLGKGTGEVVVESSAGA